MNESRTPRRWIARISPLLVLAAVGWPLGDLALADSEHRAVPNAGEPVDGAAASDSSVPATTEPVDATEPPVDTTEPPVETTEPIETTEPPVDTTEPVVETTEPVVETTEPLVETTEPPVETTGPAVETTEPTESVTAAPTTTVVTTSTTAPPTAVDVASAPLAATMAVAAPSAPRSYRVTGVGDGRVTLAWSTPASGVPTSGYLLAYAPAGGSWRTVSLGKRTSWTLTGLRNGTRYYVYLFAVNSGGRSPVAKATALLPSGTPRSYRVTGVGDGRVTLAWSTPASGVPTSGYFLAYAPAGGSWRTVSLGIRTSWTLTGLRNGTRYYVYLYAASIGGKSPVAKATALLPSGTPRSYRVTAVGNGRVSLAWTAPASGAPLSGYHLAYAPAGGSWRSISLGGRTSFTLTGLRNGTRYYLYLYAASGGGRSGPARMSAVPSGPSSPINSGNCPAARNTPGGADPFGGCWPGAHNTGPRGTLTAYTGPCTITVDGTVIDSKIVRCPWDLSIRANNVTIRNSMVFAHITFVEGGRGDGLVIVDSYVNGAPDGPRQVGVVDGTGHRFTITRSEIVGGQRGVWCTGCTIRDSWIHGTSLDPNGDWHASAVRLDQNSTVIHSVLHCSAPETGGGNGGCSANQTGYPDFSPMHHWRLERNLFVANPEMFFCAYGGATSGKPYSNDPQNATYIVYVDNVWQGGSTNECGVAGPITDFDSGRTGNQWVNNRWGTGRVIPIPN